MKIDDRVSGKTRLVGIIGNPLEHSISPYLHNSISSLLGVDFIYVPFRVEKESLENAVKGLKAINVVGFNVTIPYKKDIMKFIDDNTKEALLMGAVNTVKYIEGRFYGYNTDAEGFSRAFKEGTGGSFKGKKVAIIGAGGAARAIAVKIAVEGASNIALINRTLSKASDISDIINNNIREAAASSYALDDAKAKKVFSESDIIINTTSIGMYPEINVSPIDASFVFSKGQIVYDAIYNPLETKFLEEAKKAGCKTSNGLGMLFYQGIYAYEIWTGIKLSEDRIKDIYPSFLSILKN
ncbi:MAG: shikimate dehydrogenase [Clostridia bacterium]|nr:shikimate dehydrogenase [Clostridia bacterium]